MLQRHLGKEPRPEKGGKRKGIEVPDSWGSQKDFELFRHRTRSTLLQDSIRLTGLFIDYGQEAMKFIIAIYVNKRSSSFPLKYNYHFT